MLDVNDTLNPVYTQDGEKRLRTKVACDYCRKRKSKCNGEQPCSKCLDKNRNCTYTFVQKSGKGRNVNLLLVLKTRIMEQLEKHGQQVQQQFDS